MIISNVFTPPIDSKQKLDSRHERREAPTASPHSERRDAPARRGPVRNRDNDGDSGVESPSRAQARAQFAAMLAAVASADGRAPSAALTEGTPAHEALLDRLLDGSMGSPGGEFLRPDAGLHENHAADAMQYRLRGGAMEGDQYVAPVLGLARTLVDAVGSQRSPMHARINEVIGRIVARRGTTVEELLARGDDREAELLMKLDVLLSKAGTAGGRDLADASERAGSEASMAAFRLATASSAADVTTPVRDVEGLAPALQARLERVVERMKSEYGHDVSVVETVRSQERQDFLYEQGRTRPGAVVTWTRDSAHVSGDAVDVLVDGSWTNAEGFGRLQRIAQEEGLRTLGVRDPGHLELPRKDRGYAARAELTPDTLTRSPVQPLIAQTPLQSGGAASGVARVAGVAQAAAVARVADTSGSRRLEGAYAPPRTDSASPVSDSVVVVPTVVGAGAASQHSSGESAARDASPEDRKSSPAEKSRSSDGSTPPAFGAMQSATPNTNASDVTPVAAPVGAQSAERVADVQQLRDSAPAGSVSRMTLNVDTPDGGRDRITVDLRGATVDTYISTDAASADRLRVRTAELQDALGRHGLESDSVRISGTPRADSSEAARAVAGERDGLRLGGAQQGASGDGATHQGQRERAANAREWDRPESSRQSRDEQRESSKRGAGQPGQRETHNRSDR